MLQCLSCLLPHPLRVGALRVLLENRWILIFYLKQRGRGKPQKALVFWRFWQSVRKEIPPATLRSTETASRAVSPLFLNLVSHLISHDDRLLIVMVIESQLRPLRNCLASEEGQFVDVAVVVVVRDRIQGAVRIAGMVDEAGR